MGYTKKSFHLKNKKSKNIQDTKRTALSWPIDSYGEPLSPISKSYTDYHALHHCQLSLHLHIPRLSYPIH